MPSAHNGIWFGTQAHGRQWVCLTLRLMSTFLDPASPESSVFIYLGNQKIQPDSSKHSCELKIKIHKQFLERYVPSTFLLNQAHSVAPRNRSRKPVSSPSPWKVKHDQPLSALFANATRQLLCNDWPFCWAQLLYKLHKLLVLLYTVVSGVTSTQKSKSKGSVSSYQRHIHCFHIKDRKSSRQHK